MGMSKKQRAYWPFQNPRSGCGPARSLHQAQGKRDGEVDAKVVVRRYVCKGVGERMGGV